MVQLESILQFFNFFLRWFRPLSLGAWGVVVKQFLYVFVFPFFSTDSQVSEKLGSFYYFLPSHDVGIRKHGYMTHCYARCLKNCILYFIIILDFFWQLRLLC